MKTDDEGHRPTLAVRIEPGPQRCQAQAGENLLAAALSQGLILPKACTNGNCGICAVYVHRGTLTPDSQFDHLGHALLCRCSATTDAELELCYPELARRKEQSMVQIQGMEPAEERGLRLHLLQAAGRHLALCTGNRLALADARGVWMRCDVEYARGRQWQVVIPESWWARWPSPPRSLRARYPE